MLAVCWAVSKCKLFLTGLQHFTIVTEHNPLIPILNNHRLDELENPRLQRLKAWLMRYNFTATWVKGSKNNAPNALSRHPVHDPLTTDAFAELDIHDHLDMSIAEIWTISDQHNESLHLQEPRKHAEQDDQYQLLQNFILNGFPKHCRQLPESCRKYWNVQTMMILSYMVADS